MRPIRHDMMIKILSLFTLTSYGTGLAMRVRIRSMRCAILSPQTAQSPKMPAAVAAVRMRVSVRDCPVLEHLIFLTLAKQTQEERRG
jgi:hypothetical protein